MKALDDHIISIYNSFKVMLYDKSLRNNDIDDPTALTLQEVICMEIIVALKRPTISEFSSFAKLSGSNSAYRIRKLIEKGYVNKIQNADDKREFYLEATDKYSEKYGLSQEYMYKLTRALRESCSQEELAAISKGIHIIHEEMAKDIPDTLREQPVV